MARPRKEENRWEHPLYKIGFCLPIGSTVYTEVNGKRKTTGLRWDEANVDHAIDILTIRIEEYLGKSPKESDPPVPQEAATDETTEQQNSKKLLDAMDLFVIQDLVGVSDNVENFYRLAFTHYFWRDQALHDYHGIVDMMSLADNEAWALEHGRIHLKQSTRRKRMQYALRFFDWCIERDWCVKNPAKAFRMPKIEEEDPRPFEQYEVRLLIDYFNANNRHEMALLVEFISIMAGRIAETLGIMWTDIDEDSIHINGKGNRPRVFPRHMIGFERLEEILAELLPNKERNEGRLWWWTSRHTPGDLLRQACDDLGLEPGRSLHALRKTAGDWWEDELGLSDRTIVDLAGHTIAVRRKHYRRKKQASQLRNAVAKAASARAAARETESVSTWSATYPR